MLDNASKIIPMYTVFSKTFGFLFLVKNRFFVREILVLDTVSVTIACTVASVYSWLVSKYKMRTCIECFEVKMGYGIWG